MEYSTFCRFCCYVCSSRTGDTYGTLNYCNLAACHISQNHSYRLNFAENSHRKTRLVDSTNFSDYRRCFPAIVMKVCIVECSLIDFHGIDSCLPFANGHCKHIPGNLIRKS